ncbi:conjugative transfer signal peptidase TraF [Rhizobium sp. G187]|uniref:conjugative transfer signal peptidase TraF n=1 Tax=Rhizobium sp. G187 TaxID=3451352 RepID=UPI003EE73C75
MMAQADTHLRLARQRRHAVRLLASAVAVPMTLFAAGYIGGLRINTTPSEPIGLWRIVVLQRPPQVGDLVFACPPDAGQAREARARGYLRTGLCKGGFGPMIKTVIATPGQKVEVTTRVQVDGAPIAGSAVVDRDGKGRRLAAFRGGVIPPGEVFLHSPFPASWDSRYLGPVPIEGILGLAQPVYTHAP